jgi:hypothetical protein
MRARPALEALMWRTVEVSGRIEKVDGRRIVTISEKFFLEGEEIVIRQEKDGAITIYPAEPAARKPWGKGSTLFPIGKTNSLKGSKGRWAR